MAIVNDARSALQNGASTVLSTVRRQQKATRKLMRTRPQKLVKQLNRRFFARRTRRGQAFPIALVVAVGAAAVGTITGILVSRYVAAKYERDEEALYAPVEAVETIEIVATPEEAAPAD